VVRQAQLIALVGTCLIGCAVVLMAGASGVQAEASKKEEARCQGTRKIDINLPARFTTNDLPGCPKGGLLSGTDGSDDYLAGEKGDDEVRGLGGSDDVEGGPGNDILYGGPGDDSGFGDDGDDVIYGGPGDDCNLSGGDGNDVIYGGPGDDSCSDAYLRGDKGEDVIYAGPGDDTELNVSGVMNHGDGQRDELYCGEGRDTYYAEKIDYVASSCEVKLANAAPGPSESTVPVAAGGGPASGSPVPVPTSGGPSILLPAAALLLGSGILTYVILRRR
jgi:hypothetical protein